MTKDNGRTTIDLKSSLCTDNPTGSDVYPFTADPTQVVQNTGMERAGGITSIYEQETTFATAGLQSLITKRGDLLQVDASHNIRINDTSIGNVGPYAVYQRGQIPRLPDAAYTADGTIIGIVRIGSAIRVDEYNPATGAVINTRSTTFSMPSITITNVVLIKYIGMHFVDSLQFVISNSQQSYLLTESGTSVSLIGGITWTTHSQSANSWRSICWSPTLNLFVAVGQGGTNFISSSPDGITWSNRTIAANSAMLSVCWSTALGIFVAVGSGATNYSAISSDGVNWSATSSPGFQANAVCWSPTKNIFVAVANNQAVAWTSVDGVVWSTHTLENNSWNSVCWSSPLGLFVAVGTGTSGHYAASSPDGLTWNTRHWRQLHLGNQYVGLINCLFSWRLPSVQVQI